MRKIRLVWGLVAAILLFACCLEGPLHIPSAKAAGSGTLRQEINLLDSNYSATNNTISSDEFSQLDSTKYSGTASYYFEVVGSATTGSSGSIHLRRHGTTTDDTTINSSGLGTSSTRLRSAAFTAPVSPTEYFVYADAGGASKTVTIKAARIIIIQTSAPLTSTETQLEIGSHLIGQTNTTYQSLPNPKYWTYKASAWDNSPSFYAEVTYKTLNTTVAVWLQEDDGQYGAWTDKVIVAQADTAPVRTRTAFTPVDGKHYRLATIMTGATGTYNYDIYSAKIVVDQTGTSMDPITKLQPQYLLINSLDTGTNGVQGFQTLYNAAEWSGTQKYKFAIDSGSTFNSAKLADISNSNTDIAKSSLNGSNQQIGPTPQYIQGANNYDGGAFGNQLSTSFGSNVTAGDLILVAIGAVNNSYSPSVADSQNNTYTKATEATSTSIPYKILLYYTIAGSSGPLTVYHNTTSGNEFRRIAVLEYRDVDSFDTGSGNAGETGLADSGSFTTTQDDELIFGWGISNNGITTPGFGFTARQVVGSEMTEDKTVASPGIYSALFPNTNSQWAATGAGFYKTGGLTLNFTDNHEIDTNVTNTTGSITASRVIVDLTLPNAVVSVSVSNGIVSYGTLPTSSTKDTTSGGLDNTQTASNDGTVAEDFNIKGQDSANWTLGTVIGADQYKHEFCTTGAGSPDPCDGSPTWTPLSTSYQSLASNVGAGSNKKFDLKLSMPTSSVSKAQQSVDVTIQAVEH